MTILIWSGKNYPYLEVRRKKSGLGMGTTFHIMEDKGLKITHFIYKDIKIFPGDPIILDSEGKPWKDLSYLIK